MLHDSDASEKSLYRIAPDLMERRRNHHVVCGQLSVDVDTNHSNEEEEDEGICQIKECRWELPPAAAPSCGHHVLPVHCM